MAPVKREKALHILVTVEEHAMLHRVAESEGLSAADYVRQQIRRAHAALETSAPKPRATPKRRK